jgi:hypothetical protein
VPVQPMVSIPADVALEILAADVAQRRARVEFVAVQLVLEPRQHLAALARQQRPVHVAEGLRVVVVHDVVDLQVVGRGEGERAELAVGVGEGSWLFVASRAELVVVDVVGAAVPLVRIAVGEVDAADEARVALLGVRGLSGF